MAATERNSINPLEEILTSDVDDKHLMALLDATAPPPVPPLPTSDQGNGTRENPVTMNHPMQPQHHQQQYGPNSGLTASAASGGGVYNHTGAPGEIYGNAHHTIVRTSGQQQVQQVLQQQHSNFSNNITNTIAATLTNVSGNFIDRNIQLQQAQSLANSLLAMNGKNENTTLGNGIAQAPGTRIGVTMTNSFVNTNPDPNRPPSASASMVNSVNNSMVGSPVNNQQRPMIIANRSTISMQQQPTGGIVDAPRQPFPAFNNRMQSASNTVARLQAGLGARLLATMPQRFTMSSPSVTSSATSAALLRPSNQMMMGGIVPSSMTQIMPQATTGAAARNILPAGGMVFQPRQPVQILNIGTPGGANLPAGMMRLAPMSSAQTSSAAALNFRTLAPRVAMNSAQAVLTQQQQSQLQGIGIRSLTSVQQQQQSQQQPTQAMQPIRQQGTTVTITVT